MVVSVCATNIYVSILGRREVKKTQNIQNSMSVFMCELRTIQNEGTNKININLKKKDGHLRNLQHCGKFFVIGLLVLPYNDVFSTYFSRHNGYQGIACIGNSQN